MSGLRDHLASGASTVCRAWEIARRDGVRFGFTDHDLDLTFDGRTFAAAGGMSALAIEKSAGMAVDNTEVIGILTSSRISEADIDAGRYDGAEVRCWLVNWTDTASRELRFRGTVGEIRRAGGQFTAELRGLKDALNQPQGRAYQRRCGAVLGDGACRFDTALPGFFHVAEVMGFDEDGALVVAAIPDAEAGWFSGGVIEGLSGDAAGLRGLVRVDATQADGGRLLTLWEPLAGLAAGDQVRVVAGCDKSFKTCVGKFGNQLNFRGFPDIPGDNWLTSIPKADQSLGGGSRR